MNTMNILLDVSAVLICVTVGIICYCMIKRYIPESLTWLGNGLSFAGLWYLFEKISVLV